MHKHFFLKLDLLHKLFVAALDAAFVRDGVFDPLKRDELVQNAEALAVNADKWTAWATIAITSAAEGINNVLTLLEVTREREISRLYDLRISSNCCNNSYILHWLSASRCTACC